MEQMNINQKALGVLTVIQAVNTTYIVVMKTCLQVLNETALQPNQLLVIASLTGYHNLSSSRALTRK